MVSCIANAKPRRLLVLAGLIVLVILVGMAGPAAAQAPVRPSVTLVPEQNQLDKAGSITIVVLIDNPTGLPLENLDFALLPAPTSITQLTPVPTSVLSQTMATASYRIELASEGTFNLLGRLAYTAAGQQQVAAGQVVITVQPAESAWIVWSQPLLILFGSVLGVGGGALGELFKGKIDQRRQGKKAASVLLAALGASKQAVADNISPALEFWQEVYFKEGLHLALLARAKTAQQRETIAELPTLYARLSYYAENPTHTSRSDLIKSLEHAAAVLIQVP